MSSVKALVAHPFEHQVTPSRIVNRPPNVKSAVRKNGRPLSSWAQAGDRDDRAQPWQNNCRERPENRQPMVDSNAPARHDAAAELRDSQGRGGRVVEGTRLLIRYGGFSQVITCRKKKENQGFPDPERRLRSLKFRSSWTLLDTLGRKSFRKFAKSARTKS